MLVLLFVLILFGFFFSVAMWFLTLPSAREEMRQRKIVRRATHIHKTFDDDVQMKRFIVSDIPFVNRFLHRYPAFLTFALDLQKSGVDLNFLIFFVICILLSFFGIFLFAGILRLGTAGFIGGIVIGLLPIVYVRVKAITKQKKFEDNFVNALNIIKNALKSGQGLTAALRIVSEDASWPVNEEFKRVLAEVEYGFSFDESIDRLGLRIRLEELSFFISTVKIQRQAGGNLAQIIENIENTVRTRFELKREIKTLSAQGKVSGFVLVAMPIVLVVVLGILNPGFLNPLFEDDIGRKVLILSIVDGVLGIFWIQRIVDIKL